MRYEWWWRGRIPALSDTANPYIDGDTVRIELDRGLEASRTTYACRLRGVYAPELAQPGGVECQRFVRDWLLTMTVRFGKWPLLIQTFDTASGNAIRTFDRYVCDVWPADKAEPRLNDAVSDYIAANGWGGGVGA